MYETDPIGHYTSLLYGIVKSSDIYKECGEQPRVADRTHAIETTPVASSATQSPQQQI